MAQSMLAQKPRAGGALWAVALVTVVLAVGAIVTVIRNPRTLPLALVLAALAVVSRFLYTKVRAGVRGTTRTAESASPVANAGLVVAGIAVLPLIAFAVLWVALLLMIGVTWLLHVVGVA